MTTIAAGEAVRYSGEVVTASQLAVGGSVGLAGGQVATSSHGRSEGPHATEMTTDASRIGQLANRHGVVGPLRTMLDIQLGTEPVLVGSAEDNDERSGVSLFHLAALAGKGFGGNSPSPQQLGLTLQAMLL